MARRSRKSDRKIEEREREKARIREDESKT
jgi:hypothetical protein